MYHDRDRHSPWQEANNAPVLRPLESDADVDVCVIGSGIAGLSTAHLLAASGKKVVVLEDGRLGQGQTARTTAHLSNALDDRYRTLARLRGPEACRLAARSHSAAIDRIESIVAEERIDCAFERVDGYLFAGAGSEVGRLDDEFDAARDAGLAVERAARAPIESFDSGPCIRFPRQAQFHPLMYLYGLARAIARQGGTIHTQTGAIEVQDGVRPTVVTRDGQCVSAGAVVVATNVPFHDRLALHTKMAAYLSYAVSFHAPSGTIPAGLYWDDEDPYHYVRLLRLTDGDDLVMVGGEDHRTGQDDRQPGERYARLAEWARDRMPELGAVAHRWCGQVMETLDGLAFIGADPGGRENVYVATGDSGMGMTHGTLAGMILTDLIAGRQSEWSELYSPSRAPLSTATRFAAENARTLKGYVDWLTPGEIADPEDLAPGHGAVIRRGFQKYACYRNDAGALHQFSAICPHLGCLVRWNDADRSWDCPCHGSRFDATGHVTNGPANSNLERVECKAYRFANDH